ncbi:uncharacterized protein G2W53_008338 [Senna tora]|uniref:Uncharacterized protein n=1 Tax=Senna tora TaxID=362788 RepID=A0A834X7N7_9FABA|nr:uncharacterized protein G2W53_008338 [Senna tora]
MALSRQSYSHPANRYTAHQPNLNEDGKRLSYSKGGVCTTHYSSTGESRGAFRGVIKGWSANRGHEDSCLY